MFLLSVYDTSSLVDTLYLAKGNGAGSFAPAVALGASATGVASAQQLLVADTNGDGIPDVVLSDGGGESVMFTRSAGGTYTSSPISGIVLGIADLNHDGINDLITAAPGLRFHIHFLSRRAIQDQLDYDDAVPVQCWELASGRRG